MKDMDPFTSAAALNQVKLTIERLSTRADLVQAIYSDKEALVASYTADEIYEAICEGRLDIEGINGDLIRLRENGSGKTEKDLNNQVNSEIDKIDAYVSKITGVSLKRIKKASRFWLDNVLD